MAVKERVEPTIGEVQAPAAEAREPALIEPTIQSVVEQVNALESAGLKPNEFDGSEADKAYQARVAAILAAAHARIEKTDQEAQELLAISQRAIKPAEGIPYDTYGEPLSLDIAADMRLAQIALQDEEAAQKFYAKFVEGVGKRNAATIMPLAMGNVSLLLAPDNLKDVKEIAPKFFTESYSQHLHDSGKALLESAGFGPDVIDRLDPQFLRYMGATQQHESAFPIEGPGVADRLKEPSVKSMVIDALGNQNVQRSLKWAGLIASCATGGIVVKAGMTGSKFLLGKLAENENVKTFASKLESSSIKFVAEKFNLDAVKIRKNVENTKDSIQSIFRNRWVGLATGIAVVGISVALGHIDAVHNVAQDVAGRFSELAHSGFELVSPSDGLIRQVVSEDYVRSLASVGHEATNKTIDHASTTVSGLEPVKVSAPDLNAQSINPNPQEFSAARADTGLGIPVEVRFPAGSEGLHADASVAAPVGGEPSASVTANVSDATEKSTAAVTPPVGNAVHVVQAHDTVSSIAMKELQARGLPVNRENIYKLVDQIYDHNKDLIGQDVNKIFPGQSLSLMFEPQNLNLGHHAAQAAVSSAFNGFEVSASRVEVPSSVSPRSVLGATGEQMVSGTTLEALNPVPKIEQSAELAALLHNDPDSAIVSVPAPARTITPNMAFVGSPDVHHQADVAQLMREVDEEKLRDLADEQDKIPKKWHGPLVDDGYGRG